MHTRHSYAIADLLRGGFGSQSRLASGRLLLGFEHGIFPAERSSAPQRLCSIHPPEAAKPTPTHRGDRPCPGRSSVARVPAAPITDGAASPPS